MAYVDLPANSGLAAGMFVSGAFDLPASDALSVPESALVFRNGNRYVMQIDDGHRVHEIKVQTGRRHGNDVEVVAGVDAGVRVALSGGAFLNDGDLVNVAKQQAAK
jgi:multidrug efflux pump subunit AcrA (membrane-fusion protein)